MPLPYPTRNQSGFSRRGAEAPVPLQKKAPDESGAEEEGRCRPDAVGPLSASWLRSSSEEPLRVSVSLWICWCSSAWTSSAAVENAASASDNGSGSFFTRNADVID